MEKVQDASLVKAHKFGNPPTGARVNVFTMCSQTSTGTVMFAYFPHVRSCFTLNRLHLQRMLHFFGFFIFLIMVSTMSGGIWGGGGTDEKKGRKCKCKQMFNSTHRMSGITDIPQLYCNEIPSTIIYTLIFVHTRPHSCNSSLISLLKSSRDIPVITNTLFTFLERVNNKRCNYKRRVSRVRGRCGGAV